MKIKLRDYLFGDEPGGYQYRGEKTDQQKLQALYDKLYKLIDSCSEWGSDMKYASSYDLDEIENLDDQCRIIRDRMDRALAMVEFDEFPIEVEDLSDTEKDEIAWDMEGVGLLTEALAESMKKKAQDTRKRNRHRVGYEDWTRSTYSKTRTMQRRNARAGVRELKKAA